ncbi:uncharacterized protein LOC129778313 [Toxorhynchites rutilus septentrionalis]|uniref:uncharacterized protein LOC129778313 n=1 Tax=Toxorhynchites rutilus septentrionalis TaxID=329112 RepID=UPI00247A8869|nr:uncharacterized protein LOC129778313 [Toxorhynchites rutilus septentrionalis]XP_055641114.1 uncharacterized protein LOC129778313 [Toxorhynchites rutilus septentrionalis]
MHMVPFPNVPGSVSSAVMDLVHTDICGHRQNVDIIVKMTRCMLVHGNLNKRFWGETVVTTNYMQNRLSSRSITDTPYERWIGRKSNFGHISRFGVDAYCYVPSAKRGKLDSKAVKLRFDGYSEAYRLVDEMTGKVTISRDVRFLTSCGPESESMEERLVVPSINVQRMDPVCEVVSIESGDDEESNDDDGSDEEVVETVIAPILWWVARSMWMPVCPVGQHDPFLV